MITGTANPVLTVPEHSPVAVTVPETRPGRARCWLTAHSSAPVCRARSRAPQGTAGHGSPHLTPAGVRRALLTARRPWVTRTYLSSTACSWLKVTASWDTKQQQPVSAGVETRREAPDGACPLGVMGSAARAAGAGRGLPPGAPLGHCGPPLPPRPPPLRRPRAWRRPHSPTADWGPGPAGAASAARSAEQSSARPRARRAARPPGGSMLAVPGGPCPPTAARGTAPAGRGGKGRAQRFPSPGRAGEARASLGELLEGRFLTGKCGVTA